MGGWFGHIEEAVGRLEWGLEPGNLVECAYAWAGIGRSAGFEEGC